MNEEQLSFEGMGIDDLLKRSIELLKKNEPPDGYYGCFSGGKDSVVIKHLAKLADVRVKWHYNVTTIDPPELIYFMREHHRDVRWDKPPTGNFFRRMETATGFPTRRNRWCCREYKESRNPKGATLLLGIRAEESARRKEVWKPVTYHRQTESDAILPICGWPSEELWQFIHGEGLPYCKLYDEGFHRLGCIGCPMSRQERRMQFERWPKFERRWVLSFERIWNMRSGHLDRRGRVWFGDRHFKSWQEMWDWWMSDESLPKIEDESLFDGR